MRCLRSLARSARLLTLVGPPGVGKSRLAKELITRTGGNAICQVDLSGLPTDGSPECAVADRFGVPTARLADTIADTRVLVVLDSCEHLIDQCATLVADLLCGCARLRFVATSQQPLRVPGEVTFRVGPLAIPEPVTDNRQALRTDAVRLFIARAQETLPGFAPRADDIGVVADICRACDGLPSAVERAAGQVGHRPLREIHTGTAHPATTAATARAYHLLTTAEQRALRQLSVLPGGFDLDTARAVCATPDDVVSLVCALAAKSMISTVTCDSGTARFRLLGGIRAYVSGLADAAEVAASQERAVAWLCRWAQSLADTLFVTDTGYPRLTQQDTNLVAALRFPAAQTNDRHILLAVTAARLLWHGQQPTAARDLLAEIRERSQRSPWHSDVLALSALAASAQADDENALDFAEQAVTVADRPLGTARAWEALGFTRACRGESTAAVAAYLTCLDIVRAHGTPLAVAQCQHGLAWTLLMAGKPLAAKHFLDDAVPVITANAASRSRIAVSNTVGALHLALDDQDAARKAFITSLRAAHPGDHLTSYALDGLAILAARHNDAVRVLTLSTAAAQIRTRCGVVVSGAWQRSVDLAVTTATRLIGPERTHDATVAGRRLRGERLLAYALRDDATDPPNAGTLTSRERQIAGLVAEGMTDREIAEGLGLAQRTIRAHLTSIHQKLDLRSRIQVAVWTTRRPDSAGAR